MALVRGTAGFLRDWRLIRFVRTARLALTFRTARGDLARRVGRLPERAFCFRFPAGTVFLPRFRAFRLAMTSSFRNLDSLAISVVLSDAYR
jgi:hypothetical protein